MNHFTYVHCCSNWYPICVSLLKSTEFSIMNLFLQKWISHLLEIYSVNITVFGIWSSVSLIRKWYVALCQVLICFYSVELFLALFVFQYSIIKWQFLFWNKAIFRCVCVCVYGPLWSPTKSINRHWCRVTLCFGYATKASSFIIQINCNLSFSSFFFGWSVIWLYASFSHTNPPLVFPSPRRFQF